VSNFDTRLGRLRTFWPTEPEPVADLTRLTADEHAQLEAVLRSVPEDGSLAVLSDDELDLLRELQRVAWTY
jgi:hypothetical protein